MKHCILGFVLVITALALTCTDLMAQAGKSGARPVGGKVETGIDPEEKADFVMVLQRAGQESERVEKLRDALLQLDKLSIEKSPGSLTVGVKLFSQKQAFKNAREARLGIERMVLTLFDLVGRRYGVTIVTIPLRVFHNGKFLETSPPPRDDLLVFGLESVRFLTKFTPEAIQRTGLKRIVVSEKYLLNGRSHSNASASPNMIVMEIKNMVEGPATTCFHELYHVFDMTMMGHTHVDKDLEWFARNPPGFIYQGYNAFFGADGKPTTTKLPDPPIGFLQAYSTASAAEDKAVVFQVMMTDPNSLAEKMKNDRYLRAKVELIESRLRLLGPEFRPGFWRTAEKTESR